MSDSYEIFIHTRHGCFTVIVAIVRQLHDSLVAVKLNINQLDGYQGPLLLTCIYTLIPTWIINHISSILCDDITYQFPNFNNDVHRYSFGMSK